MFLVRFRILFLSMQILQKTDNSNLESCINCHEYFNEIAELKKQVETLKKEIAEKKIALKQFLINQQINVLSNKIHVQQWDSETIMKSLKICFPVDVHRFQYLRQRNFPLPCYSTITHRLQGLTLEFGLFKSMLEPLAFKVQQLVKEDRFCNQGKRYGKITLGNTDKLRNKVLFVLLRSVKNNWKQVTGAHITSGSPAPELSKQFIYDYINFCKTAGLNVVSLSSNMGNENRSLWKESGVKIQKPGIRQNYFTYDDNNMFIMPDVCHLIKNLKSTALKNSIKLPIEYCEAEGSYRICAFKFVADLWNIEQRKNSNRDEEHRLLHHLKREVIYSNNFQKMNVGSAVRFVSLKTAAAVETAVNCKLLPKAALTTDKKYDYLQKLIGLVEQTEFGINGWKPLNIGLIMSSLSIIETSELLFCNGFDFVLCHRFTQDAVEILFSQMRHEAGRTPNYISDVKRSSYMDDSDEFLLNHFKKVPENFNSTSIDILHPTYNVKSLELLDYIENISGALKIIPEYDMNIVFHLAGSATNAILKVSCNECYTFMCNTTETENLPEKYKFYTKLLNKGGLKEPCIIQYF
ncbi:hypothetical protein QTP88_029276 [Uroleucon formosanum]